MEPITIKPSQLKSHLTKRFWIYTSTMENCQFQLETLEIEDANNCTQEYYLFIHIYKNKVDMEAELKEILKHLDLLAGGDDQYFDYNPDALETCIKLALVIGKLDDYYPQIMGKLKTYLDDPDIQSGEEESIDEYGKIYDDFYGYVKSIQSEMLDIMQG